MNSDEEIAVVVAACIIGAAVILVLPWVIERLVVWAPWLYPEVLP